jgi:hypothetical protein
MFRPGLFDSSLPAALLAIGCGRAPDPATPAAPPPGPGARLSCQSSGKNAFETYGAPAFFAITKAIIANVGAEMSAHGEANLGGSIAKIGTGETPAFADKLPVFEGRVAAYFVWAYGGPADVEYTDGVVYHGPQDMTAAHAGMNITSAQYDYFATAIVVPALARVGVKHGVGTPADPDDISSCFAPVVADPGYKASMVGK